MSFNIYIFFFFKLATRCKMSALINAEVHEVVKPSSVDKLLQLLCPSAEIFQPSLRVFNICLQIIIYILKLHLRPFSFFFGSFVCKLCFIYLHDVAERLKPTCISLFLLRSNWSFSQSAFTSQCSFSALWFRTAPFFLASSLSSLYLSICIKTVCNMYIKYLNVLVNLFKIGPNYDPKHSNENRFYY